jgi:hypothetical protein
MTNPSYEAILAAQKGADQVRAAAPGHVAAVRRVIFDGLDEAGRRDLHRAIDRIVAAIGDADLPDTPVARRKPT